MAMLIGHLWLTNACNCYPPFRQTPTIHSALLWCRGFTRSAKVFGEPQRFGPKPMPLDADEWLCNLVRVMPVMHSEVSEVSLVFCGQGLSNLHLSFCMPSKTYGVSRCFHVTDVASKYILVSQKCFHVFSHKDVASKRSLQWEIQWEMAETTPLFR